MISRSNLFIIIFFLAAVIIGVILIWPKYQEGLKTQLEIGQVIARVQDQKSFFSDLRDLSEKLNQYSDQFKLIKSAIPEEANLPILYDFFQKFCSQKGLILTSISSNIGSISKETGIQEIDINLGVLGSYSSFKNFLSSLEKSARLFEVKSISFSSPGKEADTPFSFSLSIKTHFKGKETSPKEE